MARLALYGNVGIVRVYCQDCERMALVVGNVKQCCDQWVNEDVTGSERIIEPEAIKRQPSAKEKQAILRRQHHCCLYCDRRFGSLVWYKGKQRVLRVNYDHILPFEYCRDNSLGNFVAACHICQPLEVRQDFQLSRGGSSLCRRKVAKSRNKRGKESALNAKPDS